MKKFVALFSCCIVSSFLWIAASFSVGMDFSSLDFLWMDDVRVDVELGINTESLDIVFPLRYGRDDNNTINFLETGIFVDVYPIEGLKFFVEASFLNIGWLGGLYQPDDPLVLSSEGSLGWFLEKGDFFLKPKLTLRNPLQTEADKVVLLQRIRPFKDFRISLVGGYKF